MLLVKFSLIKCYQKDMAGNTYPALFLLTENKIKNNKMLNKNKIT